MVNRIGNIKHGEHGSLTYARWKSMMARCYNKNASNYKYYGAGGITVCDEWHDYKNFKKDMGECPSIEMTLDRIDNTKGYEPSNCRWITQEHQNKNRSHCIMLTYQGKTQNITDWAHDLGMRPQTLTMRISQLDWTVERALNQPVKKRSAK